VSTLESQRLALPQPEGVEENPDHGLDRDTVEEVAGRYLDSTGPGGARRDGHLRQIGRDCLEDEPANGFAEPEAGSKQIRRSGQLDAGEPDHHGAREKERSRRAGNDRESNIAHRWI
jgi:hypothetical protein